MDDNTPKGFPNFETLLQPILELPAQNLIAIIIGILLWLVGGYIVAYLSMKRRGIPLWHAMFPTPSGLKAVFGMNKIEWLTIIILAITSLSMVSWGFTNAL